MARPKITLYVDTVSPFAYEAYYVLRVGDHPRRDALTVALC
jgi:hypothetical protein